ncbi:cytochrome P450 [Pseudovibrio exalbescens]|uniref:cytochrome P450 n=1 Tax=Pseudovibrio exalbescens TaxID=197461 RepID=UPI0023651681|nr:cytochrome P450 [Pseudovibrio exalbescens]MDD7910256.1 cytochrome P450 [Pseudovibrio exalbescens]
MKTTSAAYSGNTGLFGPAMIENPYPLYQGLRARDPVHWDEGMGAWVLTSYEHCKTALKDPRFSSDRVSKMRHRYAEDYQELFDILSVLMVQVDEPLHGRLRDLVHHAFTRTAVETYEEPIRSRGRALIEAMLEKPEADFIADFAIPLPILVISDIVGIPEEDRHLVKKWCDDYTVVALNYYTHLTKQQLEDGLSSVRAFKLYLFERVAEIRRSPGDNLLSELVLAERDGHVLSEVELLANTILLLNAGNETTTALLGNGLKLLMDNPAQFQVLRERPELIPNAIEEFLRLDSPVQYVGRVAKEDVRLGDTTIARGELVLVMLGAAGRDPALLDEPNKLDVTRTHDHHLAFGTGHHLCAGVQLARMESRIAFEELLKMTSRIESLPGELRHSENFSLRCYKSLPVRLVAR